MFHIFTFLITFKFLYYFFFEIIFHSLARSKKEWTTTYDLTMIFLNFATYLYAPLNQSLSKINRFLIQILLFWCKIIPHLYNQVQIVVEW